MYPAVATYVRTPSSNLRGAYKSACFLSLAYTGLAVLSWFARAQKYNNLGLTSFVEHTAMTYTGEFYIKYFDFAHKQKTKTGEPGQTWIYCRLFKDEALADWAVTNHKFATALFVAMTDNNNELDNAIWEAASLQSLNSEVIKEAIRIATELRKLTLSGKDQTGYSDITKKVLGSLDRPDPPKAKKPNPPRQSDDDYHDI